jgi:carbon monoxide dehydrogenase subunit G
MQFQGTVSINAPQKKVWQFLTDADFVAKCAPGVESLEIIEPNKKFHAVASIGLGNIKARFATDVEWIELEEPNRAKVKAHGTAPGSATDVIAEMTLLEKGEQTEMSWKADITVMGTIASLASRMMGNVTEKLTAQFFECVKSKIEE